MSAHELPSDVDELRRLILAAHARLNEQQAQLTERDALITRREERIAKLEYQLHVLSKWTFGRRSEKRAQPDESSANQAWLPFADLLEAAQLVADKCDAHSTIEVHAPSAESAMPSQPRRAKRRSEFPAHLSRVRTAFELPEDARMCCSKPM
jgi:multidrug efflux pump subunit AcrA (membrane-fusion protein)